MQEIHENTSEKKTQQQNTNRKCVIENREGEQNHQEENSKTDKQLTIISSCRRKGKDKDDENKTEIPQTQSIASASLCVIIIRMASTLTF